MTSTDKSNPLAPDLDGVLESVGEDLRELRGARLFVTGGTGFVGSWLLESFLWANRIYALEAEAVVLTRDPDGFAKRAPHLASDPALAFLRGDVVDFCVPGGQFTHVVHAAAESSTRQNELEPLRMVDTIVQGTRRVLDAARPWGAEKVLFVSSGAVYGPQPLDLECMPEDWPGGPDALSPGSAYAEAKRLGELLCGIYLAQFGMPVKIARCFAFVGPYLPLDAHFAIGNFIRDGIAGGPIHVRGDGTQVRSYLYAADLAAWLWKILLQGEPGRAYNVGSEEGHTMAELARTVAAVFEPTPGVVVSGDTSANSGGGRNRYVPSTNRALADLGLKGTVALEEGVRRTVEWNTRARV